MPSQPADCPVCHTFPTWPKQTGKYFADLRTCSETSVLPTPAFLYGLQEDVAIDIEPGMIKVAEMKSPRPELAKTQTMQA